MPTSKLRPSSAELLVLREFVAAGSAGTYGLALCKKLQLRTATVYPILHRLLAEDVLSQWTDQESTRAMYKLTGHGYQQALERLAPVQLDSLDLPNILEGAT